MTTKDILLHLIRYYNSSRHCGHTNAILFGMKRNPKAMMLTLDERGVREMKHRIPEMDVIMVHELDKLAGIRRPLTIDNHALVHILSDALEEINKLEQQLRGVRIAEPTQEFYFPAADPNAYKAINVGPPPSTL